MHVEEDGADLLNNPERYYEDFNCGYCLGSSSWLQQIRQGREEITSSENVSGFFGAPPLISNLSAKS
jgi:hypothetical protein